MENILEGSKIHITQPWDYTCDIIRLTDAHVSKMNGKLCLLYEITTKEIYWASFIVEKNCKFFKMYGKIIQKNEINELKIETRNVFNVDNFIIYILSVPTYRIPSLYTFENDKRKWNEFCEQIKNNTNQITTNSIENIINVFGLQQTISSYL